MRRFIPMKKDCILFAMLLGTCVALLTNGCGANEETMRKIAREEAQKERGEFLKSFAPEKFGFGGALEKEWSHAQGVKVGNFIFISGQQPYDTDLDEKGMPKRDLETGKPFETQLRTVLENIRNVLVHYGATMDDVVFLQGFIDEKAGKNVAKFDEAAKVIKEFFPNAQHAMTFVSVDNLFGPEQLIEANAIAVMHK
jgi:enamine deaminase RidA (YjgF/YER057c/UK114 family)